MAAGVADSAEAKFYENNFRIRPYPVAPVEQRLKDLRTPGDRYFCIADFVKDGRDLSALEWGFGDPMRCIALSRFFARYHAVDICASALVQDLDEAARDGFSYSDANLNEDLPFPDGSFDVSISMMVIEHLFDPFHSFRELARIIKPGGYAFVDLPLLSSIKNRLVMLRGGLPTTSSKTWWHDRQWDGGHLHYFTIQSIRQPADEAGFDLARTYTVGRKLWIKRLWPSLLCHEGSFVFRRRQKLANRRIGSCAQALL